MLILVPLIGGTWLLVAARQNVHSALPRQAAIVLAALSLLLSLMLVVVVAAQGNSVPSVTQGLEKPGFTGAVVSPTIKFQPTWLSFQPDSGLRLQLALGADGLGAAMVLLTALVTFAVIVFALSSIEQHFVSYAGWILLSQAGLQTVFLSMDLVLFYIGFELALLPLLVLISGWGDDDRRQVAQRFVLYTLSGSIPMVLALIGIVYLYPTAHGPTVLLEELSQRASEMRATATLAGETWIFALLAIGLGIKVALLPLHTWLPTTYRSAHPTTTCLLAAVVLKLGFFGFLRIALPLTPLASEAYASSILGTLGAIAIVYGALAALAQTDIRLILAYSSLSHAGFISLGMFSLSEEGLTGAALQMFNHGITTAAMFLLAGCIITRLGSADIKSSGNGIADNYPRLAVLFLFFTFAGAGLPGLNNFVGELMALSGMMTRHPILTVVGTSGIILGAWYALLMARNLLFATETQTKVARKVSVSSDLATRETATLTVFATLCLAIGCFPQPAIDFIKAGVPISRSTSSVARTDTSINVVGRALLPVNFAATGKSARSTNSTQQDLR